MTKEKDGKEKAPLIHYEFRRVRLPAHPDQPLCFVVVKGLGEKPLTFLSAEPMGCNRAVVWRKVKAYLSS